jgi:hypothetical protein
MLLGWDRHRSYLSMFIIEKTCRAWTVSRTYGRQIGFKKLAFSGCAGLFFGICPLLQCGDLSRQSDGVVHAVSPQGLDSETPATVIANPSAVCLGRPVLARYDDMVG